MAITIYYLSRFEIDDATDGNPYYATGWYAAVNCSLDSIFNIYTDDRSHAPEPAPGVEGPYCTREEAIIALANCGHVGELTTSEIEDIGFRRGSYSNITTAALNIELADRVSEYEAYSPKWSAAAKAFADEVAYR